MAPLWMSTRLLYPLLVLLCETTAQESTNPAVTEPTSIVIPAPVNSLNGNTTNNGSAGASSETQTTPLVPVPFPVTPTTAPHNTTLDMLAIMSQRDSFQKESDRLRTAVIVLGVFFTLTAAALLAGAAWYFMKRRKSTKLRNDNRAQKTTSAELNRETRQQKTQNADGSDVENTHQKTDNTTDQQGKELRKTPPISASSKSGDYEEQSSLPDSSQRISEIVAPKTNKVVYVNTDANPPQPTDAEELDSQEVYVELDTGNTRDSADAKILTQSSVPEQPTPKDDVYENFTSDAHKNYSALDTEAQYEHHYE